MSTRSDSLPAPQFYAPGEGRRAVRIWLLEALLVFAILVGMIGAAGPFYTGFIKDARKAEAKGALAAIQSAELAMYQRTGTYVAASSNSALLSSLNLDLGKVADNWSFVVTARGASGYVVEATGIGPAAAGTVLRVRMVYDKSASPPVSLTDLS